MKNIENTDQDFILTQFSDDDINRHLFDAEPVKNLKETDEIIKYYLQSELKGQHRCLDFDKLIRWYKNRNQWVL